MWLTGSNTQTPAQARAAWGSGLTAWVMKFFAQMTAPTARSNCFRTSISFEKNSNFHRASCTAWNLVWTTLDICRSRPSVVATSCAIDGTAELFVESSRRILSYFSMSRLFSLSFFKSSYARSHKSSFVTDTCDSDPSPSCTEVVWFWVIVVVGREGGSSEGLSVVSLRREALVF